MRAAWLPLSALAALTARADPVPPGYERIPVINMQLDGTAKFETIVLLSPPTDALLIHGCIREFDAPSLRCYMLDTTALKWITFDVKLKQ